MLNKINNIKMFTGAKAWRYFWISIIVGVAWFVVESSFIFVMQGFLSTIGLLSREKSFLPSWYPTGLGASVLMLFLFGMFRAFIQMLKIYYSSLAQLSFTSGQRLNLLSYGLKNAHMISSKDLVSIFSETTSQSGVAIYNTAMLINVLLSTSLFFLAGLKLAPYEMLIGVVLLALCLYPLKYITNGINGFGVGLIKEWGNVSEYLLRGLKNNFFLSIYNQVDVEIKKGEKSLDTYKDHYMNYALVSGFASAFPLLIGVAVLSIITYMSVRFFSTDAIELVSFFYLFIRLAQALSEVNSTVSSLKLNLPGLRMLYKWSEKAKSMQEKTKCSRIVVNEADIMLEVKNLSFGYTADKMLFENLSLKIKKSDILVIKGESGVGKSTLLTLILGLRSPTKGDIYINSVSSKDVSFDFHKVLAYVGPEPYLIEGSVRENLKYGLDTDVNVTDGDLWHSLELMGLDSSIMELPRKLDEIINDIPQFSTGQRQRLSFARAIVRKPSFLILDEATANLDLATEKRIIDNLDFLFKNSTTIVITHKNSFDGLATHELALK
jgi:ABC-type multidrug transport system fused ATPase/permease subunit